MTENLTVIIPTRDRADVLQHTLTATLRLNDPNMTVLVSDNASVDETPDVLKTFQDSRLRVIRTPARCSMRANWEYALSHVSDGWVTVIGDDDAILPGAHEMVQKISAETGVEAIRSLTAKYSWPNKERPAGLEIPLSQGYSIRSSSRVLSQVMSGQMHYTTLPVLYNGGFIKVSAMRRMALSNNTVFGGSIPDVYTGLVLCSVLDSYALCKEPLAINGASRHSGGTSAMASGNSAPLKASNPYRKFVDENDVPYHKLIPLLSDGRIAPSEYAHVLETFLTAQDAGIRLPVMINMLEQYEIIRDEFKRRGTIAQNENWLARFRELNKINPHDTNVVNKLEKALKSFKRGVEVANRIDIHVAKPAHDRDLQTIVEAVDYCSRLKENPPNRLLNAFSRLTDRLRHPGERPYKDHPQSSSPS